ncbi:PadR family transcriptional regulator [Candidatus Bathyarchaeota archaeon]|nr:PadR family transcriptional regulator [Candidatus Bathyarchaeota archaeon]
MTDVEEDFVKATIRGFSRAIILWIISQRPMSGYKMVEEMKRLTERDFSSGVIYPLLYELENKKLISGKWVQKGRRRIKYYSITEEGTKLLNNLRELFEKPVREVLKSILNEKRT